MGEPRYPSLFQVNTRVRLAELEAVLGRPATLDDITDTELDALARDGFDLVWFLGIWQTGPAGRAVSRRTPTGWPSTGACCPTSARRTSSAPPSPSATTTFTPTSAAMSRWRACGSGCGSRGLRLVLDFVPNHVAPDHPWVDEHPEFFIEASEEQLAAQPWNYRAFETANGRRILAYGRDPYFAGWPDTLQLNYGNPALQEALLGELRRVAGQCDGVRCDMAMLVLPEIFERTWGIATTPFWPRATAAVRAEVPSFLFLAEVYWDLEWTLQQQGFDYTYDKRLYDRLVAGAARPVREHLYAGLDYQDHLARFLENHDEPRAAATFTPRGPPGCRRDHVPHARPAVPPPGPARRPAHPDPHAPWSGTHRGARRWNRRLLRPPPGLPGPPVLPRRPVAAARRPIGVAGQRVE